MKFTVACLLLAFALFADAFDTNNFLRKNCVETKDSIVCRNFDFTAAEKNDIQKTKFTISNAPKVQFWYADIGSFNENLVNKFPNAIDFEIIGCYVYLNYSVSSISTNNGKLQKLTFENGNYYLNANSAALSKLTALKTFEFKNPQYLQTPYFDDVFLSKNTNLETVDIRGALIDLVTPKAFVSLKKLTTLKVIGTGLKSLDVNLIKSNTLLKEVNFDSNDIKNIPTNAFFPKSLEKISLRYNSLQVVTNKTFAGLNKLKTLSLSNNKINIISDGALNLPALEYLHLDTNAIYEFERKHIESCKNLKEFLLQGNRLNKIPNNLLDNFDNLVNVVISNY